MWWRIKKQLNIIVKIVLVFSIIASLYIYVNVVKKPTCFDVVLNGDERGIDCGGSCSLYCKQDVGTPEIIDKGFIKTDKSTYQFYSLMNIPFSRAINPHSDWQVTLLDKDKKEIIKDPIVIKSYITSDRHTYILSDEVSLEREPIYMFWKEVSSGAYIKPAENFANANIKIRNTLLSENDMYTIIDGSMIHEIKNEQFRFVDIFVLLYNEDDKIFATSKQRIENMEFNKEYPLHITFLKSKLKQKVSRFSVIPQIVPLGFFK